MRFRITRNTAGQYYFEIQSAGNWETLATSESYMHKADCERAIQLVKAGAASASVNDET
ncbi:MAG TPA: DUF1508 domain-containing protein [Chloroflexota bacterium]|jgi:uncharacterized protein YegP (UPF0339 family)|nr:DUF1508 domain-containing protein [Chloroflexota bacterium]